VSVTLVNGPLSDAVSTVTLTLPGLLIVNVFAFPLEPAAAVPRVSDLGPLSATRSPVPASEIFGSGPPLKGIASVAENSPTVAGWKFSSKMQVFFGASVCPEQWSESVTIAKGAAGEIVPMTADTLFEVLVTVTFFALLALVASTFPKLILPGAALRTAESTTCPILSPVYSVN